MTGGHTCRPRRRWRCRQARCRTLVLSVVCAGYLGTQLGSGVSAAFTSHTGATTGTLSFAQLGASFATGTNDLGGAGGVGGSTYTMAVSVTLLTSSHRYTTLTNTGSVIEALNGTLTATGLSGTLNVAVDACTAAYVLGACPLGATPASLLATTSVSGAPAVSYGPIAVSSFRYLRYTFTTPASASATVTATAVPTGTGTGDRTAG